MTSDETRHSTLRGNRNAFRGIVILAVVLLLIAVLAVFNWGLALAVPLVVLVGVAFAGTLWVMGMKGRRR